MAECDCCSLLCLGCCDNHHLCCLNIDNLCYVCCCLDNDTEYNNYTSMPINIDNQTNYGTHKLDANNYADAVYAADINTNLPIHNNDISSFVKKSATQKMV